MLLKGNNPHGYLLPLFAGGFVAFIATGGQAEASAELACAALCGD
jgi:hypothetical protein